MVVLARGHSIAKWRKVSNTYQFSYRRVFSLLRLCLLAVRHVVHLVDDTDDYFRYFACYENAKRNNLQNQIILHIRPPCSVNLKFLTSFFKIGSFCACSIFVIVKRGTFIPEKRALSFLEMGTFSHFEKSAEHLPACVRPRFRGRCE